MWPLQATLIGKSISAYTWTAQSSLNVARICSCATGSSNAGIVAAGLGTGNVDLFSSDEFDGTSWSAGGNHSVARWYTDGAGSRDAMIMCAGPRDGDSVETYNGTSWSNGTNRTAPISYHYANGLIDAYLSYGGYNGSGQTASYSYNGSTWSAETSLPSAAFEGGQYGTSMDACGCLSPHIGTPSHLQWNGTAWSTNTTFPVNSYACRGGGSGMSGILGWGTAAGLGGVTYRWTGTSWLAVQAYPASRVGASNSKYGDCLASGGRVASSTYSTDVYLLAGA